MNIGISLIECLVDIMEARVLMGDVLSLLIGRRVYDIDRDVTGMVNTHYDSMIYYKQMGWPHFHTDIPVAELVHTAIILDHRKKIHFINESVPHDSYPNAWIDLIPSPKLEDENILTAWNNYRMVAKLVE